MVTSAELNSLTVKELASYAKELGIAGWHEMRKDELVRTLVLKSRSKQGGELFKRNIGEKHGEHKSSKEAAPIVIPSKKVKGNVQHSNGSAGKSVKDSIKDNGRKIADDPKGKNAKKESTSKKTKGLTASRDKSDFPRRNHVLQDLSAQTSPDRPDQLVLMVRDPFWIHAFWVVNPKTVERAKVAMGQFWYTATPVLRLYRLVSDGSTYPRRHFIRDTVIHGGVNNWYLDVVNPPSTFQVELGYLSREKKFFPLVSSNNVETPQQHIVDDLDKLDGNWRGVAADLGRIFKLSGGDSTNQDLKQVFEEQLGRPMSAPLLSRYRLSQQGGNQEKTKRHFMLKVEADVVIHGKTDPSVQVTIRNEPIKLNADGTFSVRFALPEKRHVFPIEAEGSDGVEMQRVILAIDRNTKILETLFQEHDEDD